jgi:hypothetical protein
LRKRKAYPFLVVVIALIHAHSIGLGMGLPFLEPAFDEFAGGDILSAIGSLASPDKLARVTNAVTCLVVAPLGLYLRFNLTDTDVKALFGVREYRRRGRRHEP